MIINMFIRYCDWTLCVGCKGGFLYLRFFAILTTLCFCEVIFKLVIFNILVCEIRVNPCNKLFVSAQDWRRYNIHDILFSIKYLILILDILPIKHLEVICFHLSGFYHSVISPFSFLILVFSVKISWDICHWQAGLR